MKIQVNRDALVKVLATSCSVIGKNSQLPILDENLFRFNGNRLEIVSSNLESTIIVGLGYENIGDGELKEFVCEGNQILKISQLLNVETIYIDVEVDENGFGTVSYGDPKRKKKYQIPISFAASTFPKLVEISDKAQKVSLRAENILKATKMCVPFCKPDELISAYRGVSIKSENGKLRVASTNGVAICAVDMVCESELSEIIISKQTCDILQLFGKDGDIQVTYDTELKKLMFSNGETVLYATLIEGKFPPIENILSSILKESYFTTDRVELAQSLKRTIQMSSYDTKAVLFDLTNGFKLSAENKDFAKKASEELSIDNKTESIDFMFSLNSTIISTFISSIETEKITMYASANNKPVMVVPDGISSDFSVNFVIMPLRINE
jgi:DNA polymerase III sliding clamp (beta) subunit (PCNA family)